MITGENPMNDFRNTYSEMADRLEDSSDRMMDGINEDEPGYGAAEASAMSIRLQAELARDQADMENEDGRVKKTGVRQAGGSFNPEGPGADD